MCLFNRLKPKDVQNFLAEAWKNVELPELPPKRERNYDNFSPSPYDVLKKDYCSYTMRLNTGRWDMYYSASYFSKDKILYFHIIYFNLTITNPDTIKALREEFKDYVFTFGSSNVELITKHFTVKNLKDVENVFNNFISTWKNNGIYQIFDKFITNEELKNKK